MGKYRFGRDAIKAGLSFTDRKEIKADKNDKTNKTIALKTPGYH